MNHPRRPGFYFHLASRCTLFAVMGLLPSRASAEMLPSFIEEYVAWNATDIVVVSHGAVGGTRVLETWKGTLAPGTAVDFDIPGNSSALPGWAETSGLTLLDKRLILFLRHPPKDAQPPLAATSWIGAGFENLTSTVWILDGKPYAFEQEMNPGPCALTLLNPTEAEFKAAIRKILTSQEALHAVQAIGDPTLRVAALLPMTTPQQLPNLRAESLVSLGQCGAKALPAIRALIHDDHYDQSLVCTALAAAAGDEAGKELTALLLDELAYWHKEGPSLTVGWWNQSQSYALMESRRNRYTLLSQLISTLGSLRYAPARPAIQDLRDLWASLPQLNDKAGLDYIVGIADNALHALDQPPPIETRKTVPG